MLLRLPFPCTLGVHSCICHAHSFNKGSALGSVIDCFPSFQKGNLRWIQYVYLVKYDKEVWNWGREKLQINKMNSVSCFPPGVCHKHTHTLFRLNCLFLKPGLKSWNLLSFSDEKPGCGSGKAQLCLVLRSEDTEMLRHDKRCHVLTECQWAFPGMPGNTHTQNLGLQMQFWVRSLHLLASLVWFVFLALPLSVVT